MIQFARLFCQKYHWSRSYRSRHGVAGLDRLGLGEHLPPGPGGGAGGAAPTLQHHRGDNLHSVIKIKINFKMVKNFYIIEWFYLCNLCVFKQMVLFLLWRENIIGNPTDKRVGFFKITLINELVRCDFLNQPKWSEWNERNEGWFRKSHRTNELIMWF